MGEITQPQLEAMQKLVLIQAEVLLGLTLRPEVRERVEAWRATLAGASDHFASSDAAERLYLAVEEAQRVATEQRGSGYFMVESKRWKAVEAAWHDLRRERSK